MFGMLVCIVLGYGDGVERPAALVAMERYRKDIRTADIEWSVQFRFPNRPLEEQFLRSRRAFSDRVLWYRGDATGVVFQRRESDPLRFQPYGALERSDGAWEYDQGALQARLKAGEPLHDADAMAIGLVPKYDSGTSLADCVWTFPDRGARRYRESKKGSLMVVTADCADGLTITWSIDPDRGWNAVRITQSTNTGEMVNEAVTSLKQYGDVWFPEAVAFYTRGLSDPIHTVRVHSASFNDPKHPRSLTPEDIGIEPGLTVLIDRQGRGESCAWDGTRLIPTREFARLMKEGKAAIAPRLVAQREKFLKPIAGQRDTKPGGALLNRRLDAWEVYTYAFIDRFKLDTAQRTAALGILSDCYRMASDHYKRHTSEFEKLETDEKNAASASQPVKRGIDARREELLRPINRIYEEQLKPRLDGLPTSVQRASAASQPSPN